MNAMKMGTVLAGLWAAGLVMQSAAATITWDADPGATGAQDGSGVWSDGPSATNWWDVAANTNWNSATPDDAVLGAGGAAGTITLGSAITAGSLTFAPVGSGTYLVRSNTLTLAGAAPVIANTANGTITAVIAGTNGFAKTGSGTLFLQNTANTIRGNIGINAGVISLGNNGGESAAGLGAGTVTIPTAGQLKFAPGSTANTYLIPNAIVLDGGTIWVEDGRQRLTNTLAVTTNGGTLTVKWDTKSLFIDGVMSGAGPLAVVQANNNTDGLHVGNPLNTYAGTISVNGSNLKLDNNRALTNATINLIVANNGLQFNTGVTAPVIGALTGSGNASIAGVTLSTGNNNADTTYSGALSGAGTLVKIGGGNFTLSGSSTHSAGTVVNGGTLTVAGAGVLANAPVTVAAGATLQLNGAIASGPVSVSGRLNIGATGSATNSALTVNTGGVLDVSAFGGYTMPDAQTIQGRGLVTGAVTAVNAARIFAGTQGTPGTLTFGNDLVLGAGFTSHFDLTNSLVAGGGVNDLLVIQGAFVPLGSTVRINPLAPLASGSYRLIDAVGGVFSSFTPTLLGNTSRDTWTLDEQANAIDLIVSAGTNQSLVWKPVTSDVWDIGTTTNWHNTAAAALDAYYDMDGVLFDDSGAASNVVRLETTVMPSSVTVNSSSNYTLTGAGRIGNGFGYRPVLTKSGGGTLTVATTNDYLGGTVVNEGAVRLATAGAAGGGAVAVQNGAALELTGDITITNALQLTGAGIANGGALRNVAGANVLTAALTVTNATRLQAAAGQLTLGGSVINSATSLAVGGAAVIQFINLSGAGQVVKDGTGLAILSGAGNTLSGGTVVQAGTLVLSNATAFAGAISNDAVVEFSSTAPNDATPDWGYTKTLTGTGTVNKTGTGWLHINQGTVALSGRINVQGGILSGNTAGSTWTGNTAGLDVSGGAVFSPHGNAIFIGELTGSGTVSNMGAAACTLTLGAAGRSGVFSGAIANNANALSLVKTGAGTQTLTGAGRHTGVTTVNAGTLELGAGATLAATPRIIVAGGATLDVTGLGAFPLGGLQALEGTGRVTGTVVTAAGSRLLPAGGGAAGTLTFDNDLTLNAGTTNMFDLGAGAPNDRIDVGGQLEPGGSVIAVNPLSPLTNGVYTLFTYVTPKTTSFATNVLGNTSRKSWLLDETTPGQINLGVSGAYAQLIWNAASSTSWDLQTSTNWFNPATGTNDVYFDGDAVLFDDTPGVTTTVSVATTLLPASVTVRTSTNVFTLTGAGGIAGGATLTKSGTNAFIVAGNQGYTGQTTIEAGTLQVGVGGTSGQLGGASGIVLSNGAILTYFLSGNPVVTNDVTGDGTVNFTGPGVQNQASYAPVQLSSGGSFSGVVQVALARIVPSGPDALGGAGINILPSGTTNGGQLYLNTGAFTNAVNLAGVGWNETAGNLGAIRLQNAACAGPLTLTANARIFAYGGTGLVQGTIAGPYELEMGGNSVLTIAPVAPVGTASNRINGGTVVAGNAQAFSPGGLAMAGGTLQLNGFNFAFDNLSGTAGAIQNGSAVTPATLTVGGDDASTSYGGTLANGGAAALAFVKTGGGTQNLAAIGNTYSGGTLVEAGTLQCGAAGNGTQSVLPPGRPVTVQTGAVLRLSATDGIGYYGGNPSMVTLNGGTFTIAAGLHGSVSNFTLNAGTITAEGLGDGRNFILDGHITVLSNDAPSVISAPQTIELRGNASHIPLVFDVARGTAAADLIVSTRLVESGSSLIFTNSGITLLTATNAYTSRTTISGATLQLGTNASLTSTLIVLTNAGTFDVRQVGAGTYAMSSAQTLAGQGSILGNVTLSNGVRLVPGLTNTAGTLAFSNNLTMNGGVTNFFELSTDADAVGNATNDLVTVTGTLTLNGDTVAVSPLTTLSNGAYTLVSASAVTGTFNPNVLYNGQRTHGLTLVYPGAPDQVQLVVNNAGPGSLVWNGTTNAAWDAGVTTNWRLGATGDYFYPGDAVTFDDTPGVLTAIQLAGTLLPAGVVVNTSTNSFTFGGGSIGGTGALTKAGGSVLVITNSAQTYTGGTVVNGGALRLAYNGGGIGVIRGVLTINTNGTVVVAGHDIFGYQTGNGLTVMNINEGTLDFQNPANNNETLTAVAVNMTGGRIMTSVGTGYLQLFNAGFGNSTINTFPSTNTAVISSRVELRQGNPSVFTVAAGSTTSGVDLLISGVMTESGAGRSIAKDGPGVMLLTAHETFTGGAIVSNGTLLVNGSLGTGPVSISPAGTLGGTGAVRGAVTSSGTVAPGFSAGRLTFSATYAQTAGGTLGIELGGTNSGVDCDTLIVSNAASLAGTLAVTLINSYEPVAGDTWTILTAGSLTGSFGTTTLPALTPATAGWDVQYTGNAVVLSVTSAPPAGYDSYTAQIPNPADRGYQNDPDGDGYANLLEYVTGGNPTNSDTVAQMKSARTNGVLALKFSRSLAATDATLYVEGSYATTNDATWTGIATNLAGSWGAAPNVSETGGPDPLDVTVADTDPAATNRFLRLRVTRP